VLGEARAVPLDPAPGAETPLGTLALRDVTRWIGLRLTDAETGAAQTFSLGTTILGLPEGRNAEILRAVVANRDAFLRYLRLLLADLADPGTLFGRGRGEGGAGRQSAEDMALLEDMVRALSGDARQLRDVERLVARLGPGTGPDGAPIVPPDFLALWETFREVLEEADDA
jgi:hypothetical protein